MSERLRILSIIAFANLPLLLLAAVNLWQVHRDAEERVAEERLGLARAAALFTDAMIDGGLTTLSSLARAPALTFTNSQLDLSGFLQQVRDRNPHWEFLGYFGADGWSISGAGIQPGELNIADRDYFLAVQSTDGPAVSRAFISRLRMIPVVVLAVPVITDTGERRVLAAGLGLSRIADQVASFSDDRTIGLTLVDSAGQVIVDPDPALVRALTPMIGRIDADRVLAGESGSVRLVGSDGIERLVAYAPVPSAQWGVLAQQPIGSALRVPQRQLLEAGTFLACAVGLASIIAWYLGGRLSWSYQREREARARAETAATELLRVTGESEARRRFLEDMVRSAPVAIAILQGPDHRYVGVNPEYQGLKPQVEMVGKTVTEVFPDAIGSGAIEQLDRVFRTGELFNAADQLRMFPNESGELRERYFTVVYSRYDDAQGEPDGVLVIAVETTDSVVARRRAEREKDEFLSTASHELKTPITSLGLAAQMLQRMRTRGSIDEEQLDRYLATIVGQVARTSQLINDLLDVSRVQTGRGVIRREPVDIAVLARLAVERMRDVLPEENQHTIRLEASGTGLVVEGDEARLDQVLENLLSNAVKYSPDGGTIEVELAANHDAVTVRVIDHGIGIAAEEREDLFAPFTRTSAARSLAIEGTGLGLYITRQIVEAHGGTIEVADTPGGGATFTLRLPLTALQPADPHVLETV